MKKTQLQKSHKIIIRKNNRAIKISIFSILDLKSIEKNLYWTFLYEILSEIMTKV